MNSEDNILRRYVNINDHIINMPSKAKNKQIVLQHIVKKFDSSIEYSETDVNIILMPLHDDYVMLRRALVEFGYLDRKADGSRYWVKQKSE